MNDLDEGVEQSFIKTADEIKLGGGTNKSEERFNIQDNFNILEYWARIN